MATVERDDVLEIIGDVLGTAAELMPTLADARTKTLICGLVGAMEREIGRRLSDLPASNDGTT